MDKRKWFMRESPERYTEEGTANVCVYMAERERVSKYANRAPIAYYEHVVRCSVQHPTCSVFSLV